MKAIIYARCSTDEKKQDVEVQLKELRSYCDNQGWSYEEVSEYSTGYRGFPLKLSKVLDLIMKGHYKVLIVHDISRFSRSSPRRVVKVILQILERGCRFIALQQKLDSDDEFMFNAFISFWTTFANMYSQNLSEKIKLGMKRAREKGMNVGRPIGSKDKRKRSNKGYFGKRGKIDLKY